MGTVGHFPAAAGAEIGGGIDAAALVAGRAALGNGNEADADRVADLGIHHGVVAVIGNLGAAIVELHRRAGLKPVVAFQTSADEADRGSAAGADLGRQTVGMRQGRQRKRYGEENDSGGAGSCWHRPAPWTA